MLAEFIIVSHSVLGLGQNHFEIRYCIDIDLEKKASEKSALFKEAGRKLADGLFRMDSTVKSADFRDYRSDSVFNGVTRKCGAVRFIPKFGHVGYTLIPGNKVSDLSLQSSVTNVGSHAYAFGIEADTVSTYENCSDGKCSVELKSSDGFSCSSESVKRYRIGETQHRDEAAWLCSAKYIDWRLENK